MKKKFNFKLTAMLVSLFIGFLLIVLGNKNKYCLSFGLIVLAGALMIYIWNKFKQTNELLKLVDEEIDETDFEDFNTITSLNDKKKALKKQKNFTCVMCMLFAVLLIVVGIVNLF